MSSDFVKIYPGFFEGSLRDAPPFARLLFLAMISKADQHGVALGTPGFWAAYVGTTVENINDALEILSSPDPDSTTSDMDGRRIEKWGDGANRWRIVNYKQYYEKHRNEERALYKREWDRKHPEKRHKSGSNRKNPTEPDKPDRENENENEKKTKVFVPPTTADVEGYMRSRGAENPNFEAERFADFYSSKGWMVGKNKMKDWQAAVRNWLRDKPKQEVGNGGYEKV